MASTAHAGYDMIYESLASTEVVRRALSLDRDAIAELGLRDPKLSIPILRQIIARPIPSEKETSKLPIKPHQDTATLRAAKKAAFHAKNARHDAKVVLAHFGDKESRDEFIMGLSSSNAVWRYWCIIAVSEINDRRAIKHLIRILDQTDIYDSDSNLKPPPPMIATAKYQRKAAAYALTMLLPDVGSEWPSDTNETVGLWKNWWRENKIRYETELSSQSTSGTEQRHQDKSQ